MKFKIVDGVLSTQDFFGCVSGTGTYVPISRFSAGGSLDITLCDAGEPGVDGDTIDLRLTGGTYDGYSKTSPLAGGNITLKQG